MPFAGPASKNFSDLFHLSDQIRYAGSSLLKKKVNWGSSLVSRWSKSLWQFQSTVHDDGAVCSGLLMPHSNWLCWSFIASSGLRKYSARCLQANGTTSHQMTVGCSCIILVVPLFASKLASANPDTKAAVTIMVVAFSSLVNVPPFFPGLCYFNFFFF